VAHATLWVRGDLPSAGDLEDFEKTRVVRSTVEARASEIYGVCVLCGLDLGIVLLSPGLRAVNIPTEVLARGAREVGGSVLQVAATANIGNMIPYPPASGGLGD